MTPNTRRSIGYEASWFVAPDGTLSDYTEYADQNAWLNIFNVSGFGDGNHTDATPGSFGKNLIGSYIGDLKFRFKPASGYPAGTYRQFTGVLGNLLGDPPHAFDGSSVMINPYNGCINKLYDAINTQIGVGESLGESAKTADSLRNYTKPFREFEKNSNAIGKVATTISRMTSVYARRASNLKAAGKTVASLWAEYVYGLGPLADQMQQLMKNQEDCLSSQYTKRERKSSRFVDEVAGTVPNSKIRTKSSASWRYEIQVVYLITNPVLFDLHKAGLLNLPALAWELARLTLVVDWMYNVGEYLQRLGDATGPGLTFVSGYVTETYRIDSTSFFYGQDDQAGWVTEGYGVGRRTYVGKERKKLTSFPLPSPPQPKLPFNWGGKRLLNAAALLATQIH